MEKPIVAQPVNEISAFYETPTLIIMFSPDLATGLSLLPALHVLFL
jgi:hypothetical protein